jgi:hypothetical protein
MLKLIFSRRSETAPSGWIVNVSVPVVGAKEPSQRLFAVGADDSATAEGLTRQAVGNLHCRISARLRLSPRALASFEIGAGEIQEMHPLGLAPAP